MAKVMAAYKGGAQNDPNNYRPLSMLCTLSKIIEHHISRPIQLASYLEFYHFFYQVSQASVADTLAKLV